MKYLAAVLIFLLCTLIGFSKASELDERKRLIDALIFDIRKISMQIEFTSDPIVIILDKISASSQIQNIWQEQIRYINQSMNCNEAWQNVLNNNQSINNILQSEEKENLDAFFSALGTSDKKAEKENAEYVYKTLDSISSRIKTETADKKRLYKNLGMLLGIAIVILII